MTSVVGPGTASAISHHLESWLGQKYGPLKTSCKERIWTPCSPAFSMYGRCFSSIASRTSGTEALSSFSALLIWMSPHFTMRAGGSGLVELFLACLWEL